MQLFFTNKAINKLQSLGYFHNICLTTLDEIHREDAKGYDSIVLRTNESEDQFSKYNHQLETHIGTVHATDKAYQLLGNDNRIDFDDFHQVFVFIKDGQMVNDNIYLDDVSSQKSQ